MVKPNEHQIEDVKKLAREVGVAAAADVEVDGLLGGARLPRVAAGSDDRRIDVLWVTLSFHYAVVSA